MANPKQSDCLNLHEFPRIQINFVKLTFVRQLNERISKLKIAAALPLSHISFSFAPFEALRKVAELRVNWYRTWPLLNQSVCNLHADWLKAYSDEQAAVEPEAAM